MKLWTFPYEGGLNPIPAFEGGFPHYKGVLNTTILTTKQPIYRQNTQMFNGGLPNRCNGTLNASDIDGANMTYVLLS